MGLILRGAGWVFGAALMVGAGVAGAQTQPSAPQPSSTPSGGCDLVRDANGNWTADPNCPTRNAPANTTPGVPTAPAAQRFPFPGDSAPTAPAAAAPQAPSPAAGDTSAPAAKRFPFPGDAAPAAPASGAAGGPGTAGQSPLKDAGSSGESSSASSSSSSSGETGSQAANPDSTDPDDPGADPAKIEAARRARRKKAEPPPPSPSAREQEDVQVAGFYQNDGNFRGAYGRAQDAVTLDATDPAAHLALADAARKLGKLDEAEKEYKQTLTLDPVPKVRKAAERALKEMTDGGE